MANPSCRLFVIHARDAPAAVVLRRGPTDWYHLVSWNTETDEFTHGAWFKGRIYEERCDLSPDGVLFLYFALKGTRGRTSYQGVWTAVSRAPWLHALTLWPWGSTWGGGGRFVGDRKIVLNGRGFEPHPDHPLVGLEVVEGNARPHASEGTVADAEWSGRDHRKRLIFARGGKLFRREGDVDRELADFNDLKPDPVPPPAWAAEPLRKTESNGALRRRRAKPRERGR